MGGCFVDWFCLLLFCGDFFVLQSDVDVCFGGDGHFGLIDFSDGLACNYDAAGSAAAAQSAAQSYSCVFAACNAAS